jgi:electron transfer flavoprotein alpha subunit
MTHDILAIAEVRDGKLKKSALEVATAAAALAAKLGGKVIALAIAKDSVADAAALGKYGVAEVVVAAGGPFGSGAPDATAKAIASFAKARGVRAVLMPHSAAGKDIAPRVAAMLDSAQLSDCVALDVDGGAITARRPVYAGKARFTVKSSAAVFVATLRPNVFTPNAIGGPDAAVSAFAAAADCTSKLVLKRVDEPQGAKKIELTEADMIVSGGRGLQKPENFALIEKLAEALGAAVGASRAVVDAGWRSHGDQVGQTGKTVSPNVYFAIGVSGAIQHLAGMSSSRVIVAINKDKEAPIFKVANYGVVGDLFEIVPALTDAITKAKAH